MKKLYLFYILIILIIGVKSCTDDNDCVVDDGCLYGYCDSGTCQYIEICGGTTDTLECYEWDCQANAPPCFISWCNPDQWSGGPKCLEEARICPSVGSCEVGFCNTSTGACQLENVCPESSEPPIEESSEPTIEESEISSEESSQDSSQESSEESSEEIPICLPEECESADFCIISVCNPDPFGTPRCIVGDRTCPNVGSCEIGYCNSTSGACELENICPEPSSEEEVCLPEDCVPDNLCYIATCNPDFPAGEKCLISEVVCQEDTECIRYYCNSTTGLCDPINYCTLPPTQSPTQTPTQTPTQSPTQTPTHKPTQPPKKLGKDCINCDDLKCEKTGRKCTYLVNEKYNHSNCKENCCSHTPTCY